MRQVASLVRAYQAVRGFEYTHAIIARPDVKYMTPLQVTPLEGVQLRVPNFGHNAGVNDKLAYGDAQPLLQIYGSQYDEKLDVPPDFGFDYAEDWMCKHLVHAKLRVGVTPICMARMRPGSFVARDVEPERGIGAPSQCTGLEFVAMPTDMDNPCLGALPRGRVDEGLRRAHPCGSATRLRCSRGGAPPGRREARAAWAEDACAEPEGVGAYVCVPSRHRGMALGS